MAKSGRRRALRSNRLSMGFRTYQWRLEIGDFELDAVKKVALTLKKAPNGSLRLGLAASALIRYAAEELARLEEGGDLMTHGRYKKALGDVQALRCGGKILTGRGR